MRTRAALWLILLGLLSAAVLPQPVSVAAHPPAGMTADCVELIRNGGFEEGAAGWDAYSAQGYELISAFNPHTGSLGAFLGGANNADDRLSQALTLPLDTTLTLNSWWYLATAETAGTFDTLTIALTAADGTLLATLATLDNTATAGQWAELTFDLTAYAGQGVVLRFAARTDQDLVTEFYLDDISLWACPNPISPTPTATATATAAATATPSPTATGMATPAGTATAFSRLYLPLIQR